LTGSLRQPYKYVTNVSERQRRCAGSLAGVRADTKLGGAFQSVTGVTGDTVLPVLSALSPMCIFDSRGVRRHLRPGHCDTGCLPASQISRCFGTSEDY